MDAKREFECRAARVDPLYEIPGPSTVPGREGYGWIPFEGLQNTRDLGGLLGLDGRRIRSGLLLRSGALNFGTESDLERLCDEYGLNVVIDFRSEWELSESPEPLDQLPGVRYVHASIINERMMGITQDEYSRAQARIRTEKQGGASSSFLALLYPHLVLDQSGIAGYRRFFQELLACEHGAILWHCSVGRDRCGIASALLETVLGVPEDEMERDYLATNVYAPAEFTADGAASLVSFHAAQDAVAREYGSFIGYVERALGITRGEMHDLQERYLEE